MSSTYEYMEENNGIKSTRAYYILMRAGGLLWRDDLGFLSYFSIIHAEITPYFLFFKVAGFKNSCLFFLVLPHFLEEEKHRERDLFLWV